MNPRVCMNERAFIPVKIRAGGWGRRKLLADSCKVSDYSRG